jgi:hypothetical protein
MFMISDDDDLGFSTSNDYYNAYREAKTSDGLCSKLDARKSISELMNPTDKRRLGLSDRAIFIVSWRDVMSLLLKHLSPVSTGAAVLLLGSKIKPDQHVDRAHQIDEIPVFSCVEVSKSKTSTAFSKPMQADIKTFNSAKELLRYLPRQTTRYIFDQSSIDVEAISGSDRASSATRKMLQKSTYISHLMTQTGQAKPGCLYDLSELLVKCSWPRSVRQPQHIGALELLIEAHNYAQSFGQIIAMLEDS